MTCASCASRVEKAVSRLSGVKQATVNLIDGTASVTYRNGIEDSLGIMKVVRDAGYDVQMKSLTFTVKGMTCAGCVRRVETMLKSLPGVVSASVSLTTEQATIEYLDSDLAQADIKEALESIGYEVEFESETPVLEEDSIEETDRLRRHKRQLIVSGALSFIILMLTFSGIFRFVEIIPERVRWMIMFILTFVVIVYAGREFYVRAWKALRHKTADMNTLIALGTGAAFIYSSFVTFSPALIPQSMQHIYFDTAAVIITLILFGRYLEARAKGRTSEAIKKLIGLQPKLARVIRDDEEIEIAIGDVRVGDLIIVKPGERIAVDGEIEDGDTFIDESMITGESVPVAKSAGDSVIGGTMNQRGSFRFRVRKVGKDTVLSHIIRLVKEAQLTKAPIQRFADYVASIFVPSVIGVAVITFIVWMVWGPEPKLNHALVTMVTVLIIACPCALGLATPTSIMVGTGKGAENGILIKNGEALELVHRVDTIVFDKTGTITEGRPVVTEIVSFQRYSPEEILRYAAAVESRSEHPLALAIMEKAKAAGISVPEVAEFIATPGHGAAGRVGDVRVFVGNLNYLKDNGIVVRGIEHDHERYALMGKTPIIVSINDIPAGLVAVADKVKQDAPEIISRLRSMGIDVIMLTGDNALTAKSVAESLGVTRFFAGVLPDDKVNYIGQLQAEGHVVAMVGDGINDAPALAKADVGIAMGSGTDIAMEAGDITLMSGKLQNLIGALKLSKATVRNIKQNLFGSFIYNTLGIPIAAGVLYPFLGIVLNPMLAAGAMAMSSVTVVTNALRLRRFNIASE